MNGFFGQQQATKQDIVALVFKMYMGDNEITALINGTLTNESSMLDVMKEWDIIQDLNITNIETCRFSIKRVSGSYLSFKYSRFESMTVEQLTRIKNLHEDYTIEIKD